MHSNYSDFEFESAEMLATSGGLGNADSDARLSYYGMSSLPSLVFNGGNFIAGAGLDAIDGTPYFPLVNSLLDDSTPVQMSISSYSFDAAGGHVTVDLALEDTGFAGYAAPIVRTYIVEDDVLYGGTTYHNVLRDMLPDQLPSISTGGQSEQITINFDVDAGWNTANLRLVSFVQENRTKVVLQTCNSLPAPDYAFRFYADGDKIVVGGSRDVGFDTAGLFNVGALTDTYDISLDVSGLPAGWSADFDYLGSSYTNLSLMLAPGERALFNVAIATPTADQGEVVLIFHSQSGQTPDRSITYKVISPDVEILLVDDDGAEDFETDYFLPAIDASGKTVATWERGVQKLTSANLAHFDAVVWQCGVSYPTLDADDRAALSGYLNGGGKLFLTGQDIGWDIHENGAEAIDWYEGYLHADYIADDTNLLTLSGVPGDPITYDLSLQISGGDGADNQEYPSDIDPIDAYASVILTYNAERNGGIKVDTGVYRLVYLSFGFEGIDNADDRALLMTRSLSWLLQSETGVGDDDMPAALTLRNNVPNPFNPLTAIKYSLAAPTEVRLGVYDVQGRLVRVLDEGLKIAGEHTLTWDGCDGAGHALSSGNYFCRIDGAGQTQSIKMMLVR